MLPLLYDIYAKYHIRQQTKHSYNAPTLKCEQFIGESPFFQTQIREKYPSIYEMIGIAMESYALRFVPALLFSHASIINDRYTSFVKYTIMMSEVLNTLVKHTEEILLPLQVYIYIYNLYFYNLYFYFIFVLKCQLPIFIYQNAFDIYLLQLALASFARTPIVNK